MATYQPAKRATAWVGYISLVDQPDTKKMKSNPTIASGDFKVSKDGGALANLTTLPSVTPASSVMVKIDLSATEMTADNVTVVCIDAAGAEWCDLVFNLQPSARQIDDLAYPATSGRSMVVDAAGLVDANAVKVGPSGSGTAQTAGDLAALSSTIAGYVDTEVAAILAAVDTEVAAIKVKTDQLTFTTANQLDVQVLSVAANAIGASAMATDAIGSAEISAAAANKIADHVWRRNSSNIEASSNGDTLTFRSPYGSVCKLTNKMAVSGSDLITYQVDDTTAIGSQAIGTNAAAEPIVSLDTA